MRRLVPDRLFVLQNKRLEVTLHPSDIAISGKKQDVARARAAIATRVTFTAAYMTTAEESQQVEDVLLAIAEGRAPAGAMGAVDDRLARLTIPARRVGGALSAAPAGGTRPARAPGGGCADRGARDRPAGLRRDVSCASWSADEGSVAAGRTIGP